MAQVPFLHNTVRLPSRDTSSILDKSSRVFPQQLTEKKLDHRGLVGDAVREIISFNFTLSLRLAYITLVYP